MNEPNRAINELTQEIDLDAKGWCNWLDSWPYGYTTVYIRRTHNPTIEIIKPDELDPSFNVADLWWQPMGAYPAE